jgi:CO/xanthine dehydrogenase FAD-binding subunit
MASQQAESKPEPLEPRFRPLLTGANVAASGIHTLVAHAVLDAIAGLIVFASLGRVAGAVRMPRVGVSEFASHCFRLARAQPQLKDAILDDQRRAALGETAAGDLVNSSELLRWRPTGWEVVAN